VDAKRLLRTRVLSARASRSVAARREAGAALAAQATAVAGGARVVAAYASVGDEPPTRLLLEALRLYPPVPSMIREAVADDVVLGMPIPAKTQVWISPWVVHRHRKYWDQPTAFLPERFAGVTAPWTSIGAFIPFSGGPRICIGAAFAMAEAQIVLATLISRFEFGLESDRPVLPKATLTVVPDVEPWFRLEPVAG